MSTKTSTARRSSSTQALALVTGASRGIGEAIARRLAQDGFEVLLVARSLLQLEKIVRSIIKDGGRARSIRCDLTLPSEVNSLCAQLLLMKRPPTLLINNAGFGGPFHLATEVSDLEWNQIFKSNLEGAVALTRCLLPVMKSRSPGFGRIVNIASVQGLLGASRSSSYVASKHALVGYSRSIAAEWGGYGITCNAICPGYIDTGMVAAYDAKAKKKLQKLLKRVPTGRMGRPSEIAALVSHLCGKDGGYINGATLVIDGGLSSHVD